jgi:hypothetical protein
MEVKIKFDMWRLVFKLKDRYHNFISSFYDYTFLSGSCAGIKIAVVDVDVVDIVVVEVVVVDSVVVEVVVVDSVIVDIVVVEVVGQPEEDELDDGYRTLSPC